MKHCVAFFLMSLFSVLQLFPAQCPPVELPSLEILVPMRDGAFLPTSIYLPEGRSGKYPCVLVRQPLGKDYVAFHWVELVRYGYMVAVQATRSCGDATGKSLPYITDGWGELQDGYDAIEWLAKSDFCNGKVATIGESATGITQLLLAPTKPPHLVCQYIEVAAPCLAKYAVWPGGQFRKEQVEGWLAAHRRDSSVVELLRSKKNDVYFWEQFNALSMAHRIDAPQMHVGGWFDIFLQGTIDAFTAAAAGGSKRSAYHKLIIGPWAHRYRYKETLGDFPALQGGMSPPCVIDYVAWLDYHMKNQSNHVHSSPAVQYYVMGPLDGTTSSGNVWRSSDSWPPHGARYKSLYLGESNDLTFDVPAGENRLLQLVGDSANPVPTLGGRNLFLPDGPKDMRSIEVRSDVAVFTSAPFTKDIEITGKLSASFYLSHIAHERDICVRLCDVYPDGRSVLIGEGGTHITAVQDALMPRKIDVDLWSTSIVFAQGHKIRCIVSGSNFPAYESYLEQSALHLCHPGIEKDICFMMHMGRDYPSALVLPVVED